MSSLGKSLEGWVRRIRPHLRPSYRKAYRQLLDRGLSQRQPGEPIVCLDLSDPKIDAVGGRYYFSLVLDLIDAGYFPVFAAHRGTLSTFGTYKAKTPLLGKRLGAVASPEDIKEPFHLITDSADAAPANAVKIVRVDYTQRIQSAPGEIPFPVFVHPQIAIKGRLPFTYDPAAERPARIFFGGNTSQGKYDKNIIGEVYSMFTRREMLDVVRSESGEAAIHRPQDAVEWLASDVPHPFVLCETQFCKIPPDRWLEALSKGDFFLACPGVGMPLCHNLIECMATGSIPILQYSRYLTPMLEDGVNCLTFRDADSLRQMVARVLAMTPQEIAGIRAGTKAYYDEFLAPGRFTHRLLGDPHADTVLLMNSYRVPR